MKRPDFTLSAGPTVASSTTLAALGSPIIHFEDPEFVAFYHETERKLAEVFSTRNDVVIMQGEVVLGLEAAARALTIPGMKVLNLVQGIFGKGMGYWLTGFGAELHEIEVPYNEAVDPQAVDAYLKQNPDIGLITMVHSETPSGTLTDCGAIGRIAKEHGVLTLVDAASSVGGHEFLPDDWGLDVCVTGSQKCLAGPVGLSLMVVSEAAWARMRENPASPRASYLSLLDWKEKWIEQEAFPYAPSISDIFGVHSTLDQVLDEGLDNAIARHQRIAQASRAGARAMGLALWPVSEEISSNCVTVVSVEDDVDAYKLLLHIREKYGVMLASSEGAGNMIRIGHMGPTASGLHPVVGLAALGRGLADFGVLTDIGAGVETLLTNLAQE